MDIFGLFLRNFPTRLFFVHVGLTEFSQLGKFLESENNFPCHLDINRSCAQGDFSEWKIYFRQEPFSFIWLVGTFEFILFLKGMLVIFWGSFE